MRSSQTPAQPPADIRVAVAASLRRLRGERALSLGALSARSGVSPAMLSQVESGRTTPSIAVLWKIAHGLGVPFSALLAPEPTDRTAVLRRAEARLILSADRRFRSRPLFFPRFGRRVEFYELTLLPRGRSRSRPHAPGTTEMLLVARGRLRLTVAGQSYDLRAGDVLEFAADREHAYENRGPGRVVAYDVIAYA